MTGVSWGPDEETVRLQPPADPWAEPTKEFHFDRPRRREVYGRVYEVITGDPRDGEHPYAGQTTQTIHQRVHGPSGHTSPASIGKDPWKARILPGRAGYRCLKVIYATGNPGADQVRLDMAEAFAIDALKTTYNGQRPIRSSGPQPKRPPREPAAPRPLTYREQVARRKSRRFRAKLIGLLFIVALFTYAAARVAVAMQMPWPAFPWIAAPVAGVTLGWSSFWYLHRSLRKLTR
jgi:hypothetical protein